jgi:hypothetical protein
MNSPRKWRLHAGVWIVAVVFSLLGVMAGLMVGLFVGQVGLCTGGGAAIGCLGGVLFEAWPQPPQ